MQNDRFLPGLVSVSFRGHTPAQIIQAAVQADLRCIEWGGDVHIPPGDPDTATQVRRMMKDAGLITSAYGSYFRIGCDTVDAFAPVLETAVTLGAPIIRVWTYDRRLSDVEEDKLTRLAQDARAIAKMAAAHNITVCMECHIGTLTENYHDAIRFLQMVDRENFGMFWQPNQQQDTSYNLSAACALAPYVTCIHAFHWDRTNRYPLSQGEKDWKRYLTAFADTGKCHPILLEFMPDDRLESLQSEANTLLAILSKFRNQ